MRPAAVLRRIAKARSFRWSTRTSTASTQSFHSASPPQVTALSSRVPPLASFFPLYRPPPPEVPFNPSKLPSDKSLERALKVRLTKRAIQDAPILSEEALREFYQALVHSGAEEISAPAVPPSISMPEERRRLSAGANDEVVRALAARLIPASAYEPTSEAESSNAAAQRSARGEPDLERVLERIGEIAPARVGHGENGIPLGLISRKEWDALFEAGISASDPRQGEVVLRLMQDHGMSYDLSKLWDLAIRYAREGLEDDLQRVHLILKEAGHPLPSAAHDAIISYHLSNPNPILRAKTAISYLKTFEALASPAPQSSYALVLSDLLRFSPNSHRSALACDLFAHMRLSAHATPSREIYTTMIASCSSSLDPQPERARDLWIEMAESGVIPEEPEYTAIIRALCSTKDTYLEGFDLFRQMLARHQEATYVPFEDEEAGLGNEGSERSGLSRWFPTINTWAALLEGVKRAGDLRRARWVLAESLRLATALENSGQVARGPDEEVMASVFMACAAWKPEVARWEVKVKDADLERSDTQDPNAKASPPTSQTSSDSRDRDDDLVQDTLLQAALPGEGEDVVAQDHLRTDPDGPRTSADALREASALFAAIVSSAPPTMGAEVSLSDAPFRDVTLSARSVNAYLSVHLAHAPSLAAARDAWSATWAAAATATQAQVRPNGWSYMQVLERCAIGNRHGAALGDREVALEWGRTLWAEYRAWSERAQNTTVHDVHEATEHSARLGLSPRQVERCWRAVIRLHALSDDLETSLSLMREFHAAYPPQAITESYAPLSESGLAIRFSDPTSLREAHVPAHLIWRDVDVLHQRLVRDERVGDVGEVKWVCLGYERALQRRRKWRMRGAGVRREGRRGTEQDAIDGRGGYGREQVKGEVEGEYNEQVELEQASEAEGLSEEEEVVKRSAAM